jgi:hypothetical protein
MMRCNGASNQFKRFRISSPLVNVQLNIPAYIYIPVYVMVFTYKIAV